MFINGAPTPVKGSTAISRPPAAHNSRASVFRRVPSGRITLQSTPAKATNQMNTDMSTCTTSAVRKKSTQGMIACTPGVRDRTSRMANRPATIRAATPSHNQRNAKERAAGVAADRV